MQAIDHIINSAAKTSTCRAARWAARSCSAGPTGRRPGRRPAQPGLCRLVQPRAGPQGHAALFGGRRQGPAEGRIRDQPGRLPRERDPLRPELRRAASSTTRLVPIGKAKADQARLVARAARSAGLRTRRRPSRGFAAVAEHLIPARDRRRRPGRNWRPDGRHCSTRRSTALWSRTGERILFRIAGRLLGSADPKLGEAAPSMHWLRSAARRARAVRAAAKVLERLCADIVSKAACGR
jgi:hypothetical protein